MTTKQKAEERIKLFKKYLKEFPLIAKQTIKMNMGHLGPLDFQIKKVIQTFDDMLSFDNEEMHKEVLYMCNEIIKTMEVEEILEQLGLL